MTLAELGMAFWHDLAAPVIAGILAGNLRQNSHALRLDHRLMEEISKFLRRQQFYQEDQLR